MGIFSKFIDKIKPYQPKDELYKLLHDCSLKIIAAEVPIVKHEKALIESILLFTAFCLITTNDDADLNNEIEIKLINEILDHIKHSANLNYERNKNFNFVCDRIRLYEKEIYYTFINNEDKAYLGGIIAHNIFEAPLNQDQENERSTDIFKHLKAFPLITDGFSKIVKYFDCYFSRRKPEFPLEMQLCLVRDKIIIQLSQYSNPDSLSNRLQTLENEYKKFIATIVAGSLISIKYKLTKNDSHDDSFMRGLLKLVLDETMLFQKEYIITDKIKFDIVSYNSLKDETFFYFYITKKYNHYSEDIEHGIKTGESYYYEDIDDLDFDHDIDISGYNNHFSFLRDLFFIDSIESENFIEIESKNYALNWDNMDEFFSFVLLLHKDM